MLGVAAGNRDRETVARLDLFGIVLEGRTGQNALGFVADVEKNLIGGERDDGALQLPCARLALVGVGALEGGEQVGEGLGSFADLFRVWLGGGFWAAVVCHDVYRSILT